MVKVNVLGSCISRVSLLDGNTKGHGTADDDIELEYYLDKQNIVCCMMPKPFDDSQIERISAEELYDPSRIHSLKQCLYKNTISMLMNSDAEYLIMDLYDFQNNIAVYRDTSFSTCAHEFFQTKLYKENEKNIGVANLLNTSTWVWYPYIDLFFDKILNRYDSDHIIVNRFRANKYYLAKDGMIQTIPEMYRRPWHADYLYNSKLARVEEYIISRYKPWVIDLSKFYMCDENKWDNLNGAHFENAFYVETFKQIRRIINRETDNRYYDIPNFNYELSGKLDVDNAIAMVGSLLDDEDVLWINILNKLKRVAPGHPVVMEYVKALEEASV